uniref:DUF5675 domain-containing protein n=1 Tax=viral metagenome TaxID=1070528 RepID=A0A6M3KIQ1_9ZZZZ
MKESFLYRKNTSDEGTEGILICGTFTCYTLEPPWRENQINISCIPTETYLVRLIQTNKFGIVYHLQAVEGRTGILQHSGTVAGDRSKGLISHTYGCQLFGYKRGMWNNQKAIFNSRVCIKDFIIYMNKESYVLHIEEEY